MESYYLLRKNQESGPYTLKELKAMPLYSTDLIWINGESTSWSHASEIECLQPLVKEPEKPRPLPKKIYSASTLEHDKMGENSLSGEKAFSTVYPQTETAVEDEIVAKPSFAELQKKYAEKPRPKVLKSQVSIGANLFGLATLVLGVTAAAYMIKKAVDNIEYEPAVVATAQAQEIQTEQLPVSTASHAAMAVAGMVPAGEPILTSEERPTTDLAEAVAQKEKSLATPAVNSKDESSYSTLAGEQGTASEPSNSPTQKEETEASKADKKKEELSTEENKGAKPQLQLSANNYKVGFLGGISNLELSVSNPSSQPINKAVVEVEYLKANGKIVGSQTVEVSGIAPGSSKKITVADYGRGVNVRYRVVNVEG